ncbi:MAG: DNA alkylation repair protein [Chloroflexota bacterium]|nr:MAG: DNA alkylation repair protein [Chloroflexota bacterium]
MAELATMGDPARVAGRTRVGIRAGASYGVSLPDIRAMARRLGRDQALARALWVTGNHDARLLAPMVADPRETTEEDAELWALDFASWDVVDTCAINLLRKTPFAWALVERWSAREEEYIRRAAFALAATLTVHDRGTDDAPFRRVLMLAESAATDDRSFVKKAVSWALRDIGGRRPGLRGEAIALAERLRDSPSRAARWVGNDALKEFQKSRR